MKNNLLISYLWSIRIEMVATTFLVALGPIVRKVLKKENRSNAMAVSRFFFAPLCVRIVLFWLVVTMIAGLFRSQLVVFVFKLCLIYGIMDGQKWPRMLLLGLAILFVLGGIYGSLFAAAGSNWSAWSFPFFTNGILLLLQFLLLKTPSSEEWR